MEQNVQSIPKVEGISPEMLWTFVVVLVGLAALFVLGYKVVEILRKEHDRRVERQQLTGQDITDRIADKVIEKIQPVLDEKFDDFDKRLTADRETLTMHTTQLNDHESRVGQLEGGNKALCHGMLALLEQSPALVNAQKAMKNYLIDGTYRESDWT